MTDALPDRGTDADDVLAAMAALREGDRDWRDGRVFSLVYTAGDDVLDLLGRAAGQFPAENALNTAVFPSLGAMQADIVAIAADLLGGSRLAGEERAGVRGFLTSGGTESLLQATRTARDHGRAGRGVTRPNVVAATTAHAAFDKAGHWFDVEIRRVDVDAGYRADVEAMADAVDDQTVLLVASAPAYPQGVIDPVLELAALAADRGVPCHVDACLGGFVLPFLGRLGLVDRPWDLAVPGVTSISADLHKYGYGAKGVSVILYRTRELGRLQPFVTSNWLGGLYGSPAMAGTRPAGPIAAGWAVLHHLGWDGYLRLAADAHRATTTLRTAIANTPGLAVRGDPDATVIAFGAETGPGGVDAFALGDELARRGGWFFDRQAPPDSLHATVHAGHLAVMDQLVADLGSAAAAVRHGSATADDRTAVYGTI